ncbi:MAG: outer membrane beta-barrel protein, partial [Bacteroidales bacterium]|nr:outer membrane beta-barrel protein [Bacteroidales bacterium]
LITTIMKKLIILLILSGMLQTSTFAQNKRHEIVAGYGMASHQTFKEITVNLAVTIFTVGNVNTVYQSGSGTFYLGYRYHLSKHFSMGIDAAYQSILEEVRNSDERVGNLKRKYITASALTNISYINRPAFQLYSTISAGYIQGKGNYTPVEGEEESMTDGFFGFQVNPVGIRFGRTVGGFVELGYGYKGVLNFGLSVKL